MPVPRGPLVTKVRAGHRMIRLCMFMKLIFLHSELEILLKKKVRDRCISSSFLPGNDW